MTQERGTVIHLIVGLNPGGAEHALLHLVRQQKKEGWSPEVYYLKSAASELRSFFEASEVPVFNAVSSPWLMTTLRERAKKGSRFLIHSHLFYADCVAWFLKGFLGCPWVSTFHSAYDFHTRHRARHEVAQRIYNRLDRGIAVTEVVGQSFVEAGAVTAFDVIANPIAETYFQCASKPLGEKRKLLALGRLAPEKRFHLALEALAQLEPTFSLDVVGTGPEEARLKKMAETLALGERVRFHGQLFDPSSLMATADLVLMPSATEGLPLVALEALAAQTPILANGVGGLPALLDESPLPTARLDSPTNLAECIRRVFEVDGLPSSWQVWAAEKAKKFSPQVIGREVTKCYETVLS